ncbi:unnamed protein product [Adineta steineri]|uniref:Uncharacterized protein n=1 Tax=Adineta steineri TaxID=433720 RepID=A0A816E3I0_9BILA|nr:unnamed protein product [Adineta steineri]CAF1644779.1 unnamed protein product [Adineta steineri]
MITVFYSENPNISFIFNLKTPQLNLTSEKSGRFRRSCDCWTTGGRCVSYGAYECVFPRGRRASVYQCVGGNQWYHKSTCYSGCQRSSSDRAICT